jgi:hypothetical protein
MYYIHACIIELEHGRLNNLIVPSSGLYKLYIHFRITLHNNMFKVWAVANYLRLIGTTSLIPPYLYTCMPCIFPDNEGKVPTCIAGGVYIVYVGSTVPVYGHVYVKYTCTHVLDL